MESGGEGSANSEGSSRPIPDEDIFDVRPEYYTQYFIDNFRSLRTFQLRLEEGLNVFVGPNGSGKTNFIDFLDFLSSLLLHGAAAATSGLGGLSRVFSQETLKGKRPRVLAQVCGLADLRHYVPKDEGRTLFRFQYDLDIRFSKHHSAIFVASESVKFKSCFWDDLAVFTDRTVGSISIRRRSPVEDDKAEWKIGKRLLTRGPRNPLRFRARTNALALHAREAADWLEAPHLGVDQSFLSQRGIAPAFDAVRAALTRGRSFNLNPAHARLSDDLSKPPFISTDGSGLSSTLYHMQRAPRTISSAARFPYTRFSPTSLETLVNWTTLVLPELEGITTSADPQTGKYLTYLVVSAQEESLRIPLQSASDGTLKWLSFVSLISSQGSLYSIEEPENYLHPRMQSFLVDLIRESLNKEHPGYFIMTTHSESIINQCKPEELLLFEFIDGKTSVRRLANADSVREQINNTGFGLGYYYAANAVS